MPLTVFSHPDCALHNPVSDHPECPERLSAIQDQIIRSGLDYVLRYETGTPASKESLYRAHSKIYVDELEQKTPQEGHIWLDPDTPMTPHSFRAAQAAAGCAISAVDYVMAEPHNQAFCLIRPPGHHATYDTAMGFCLFNNIAVAATHALHKYGLKRIAIIDFDVHHGNGTEDIFKNDQRVLFCSSFQSQFYPFSGEDTVSDHIINIPLPGGTKSLEWREAVYHGWLPEIEQFEPELILISAGFDGHTEDDVAHFFLVEDDYQWITEKLHALADRFSNGRIVSVLEGGYELSALGRSVVAHLKGLL